MINLSPSINYTPKYCTLVHETHCVLSSRGNVPFVVDDDALWLPTAMTTAFFSFVFLEVIMDEMAKKTTTMGRLLHFVHFPSRNGAALQQQTGTPSRVLFFHAVGNGH